VKTAVILPPAAASFQVVAGLPLIQRTVLSALRSGFDRILVVSTEHGDRLRELFKRDERTRLVQVTDELPAIDGTSVTLIPSDRVLTAATFRRINAVPLDGVPLIFEKAEQGGVALCRPAMLAGIDFRGLTAHGADALWAALRARGAQSMALDDEVCVRVTGESASVDAAERALCNRLRADTATSDGPLAHWIDRRISLRISRWLVRHSQLRPNHITLIGTSVGFIAAGLLSIGTYWTGIAGTLLFLCATIIDGCDGEVARLKFCESTFGEKFDVFTDNLVHVAIFVGLALGLYHRNPDGHYLVLMSLLLGGFALDVIASYFFLVKRPGFARSGGTPVSWKGKARQNLLGVFEAAMNRDFAYLLVVFAACNRLDWFFWGTAFGTYLFAILLVWIYRWRDAA
jgi:phosphatidylglycerophosphate synthase